MNTAVFTKDFAGKKIVVECSFAAPRSKVWQAWTTSSLLDQWWGPKPWNAVTKSMDFREGGSWLYAMTGPDGSKQWCIVNYESIQPEEFFTGTDAFCDETGTPMSTMPSMHWKVEFHEEGAGTKVIVTTTFAAEEDMHKIVDMGFEQGFTQGLVQLEELLSR